MKAFIDLIENKLAGPMTVLANQRHLRAIRDGIIATLPLIIVGSFCLIAGNPPLPQGWSITKFLVENAPKIVLPFRMSMSIMTLYATFGIGYSLAKSYDLDGLSGGILATLAFLLTFTPVSVPADLDAGVSGFVLAMGNLGGSGMFVGIITSLLAVEFFRLSDKSGFKISMPEGVPPSVSRSFEALVPTAVIMLFFGGLTYWVGFNWHTVVSNFMAPFVKATDSLPSVLFIAFLNSFFWVFGIHGSSIVGNLARPIWQVLLDNNAQALLEGVSAANLPQIAPEPFFQWFVYIGGSGATIGLAICMVLFSKSAYSKSLGKAVIGPSLFNINEPVIFGAPIVLNPILMIPFVVAPMVLSAIAWFAVSLNFVNKIQVIAPWTLPGPIGAFIATGGDFRAAILNIVLVIVSVLIFYPFFKSYDKGLLEEELNK